MDFRTKILKWTIDFEKTFFLYFFKVCIFWENNWPIRDFLEDFNKKMQKFLIKNWLGNFCMNFELHKRDFCGFRWDLFHFYPKYHKDGINYFTYLTYSLLGKIMVPFFIGIRNWLSTDDEYWSFHFTSPFRNRAAAFNLTTENHPEPNLTFYLGGRPTCPAANEVLKYFQDFSFLHVSDLLMEIQNFLNRTYESKFWLARC